MDFERAETPTQVQTRLRHQQRIHLRPSAAPATSLATLKKELRSFSLLKRYLPIVLAVASTASVSLVSRWWIAR
jgi:hypothetical protein